jgi:ABC-type transporter Mla subunit MlaD
MTLDEFNTSLENALELTHNLAESFPDNHPDFEELTNSLNAALDNLQHVSNVLEFTGEWV